MYVFLLYPYFIKAGGDEYEHEYWRCSWGQRKEVGVTPPLAAATIAVSSIAISSIVANPSTDHVPGGGSVTDGTAEGAKMGEDGSGIATVTPPPPPPPPPLLPSSLTPSTNRLP